MIWNIKYKQLNWRWKLVQRRRLENLVFQPTPCQYRLGNLSLGAGTQTPQRAMTLSEEIQLLRKQVKEQNKEIKRLREENEFLEEASAFFAASRRRSARTKE